MSRVAPTTGLWLVAGTWVHSRYPCECRRRNGRNCRSKWCTCWGRDDIHDLPSTCCAPKHPKHAERTETA